MAASLTRLRTSNRTSPIRTSGYRRWRSISTSWKRNMKRRRKLAVVRRNRRLKSAHRQRSFKSTILRRSWWTSRWSRRRRRSRWSGRRNNMRSFKKRRSRRRIDCAKNASSLFKQSASSRVKSHYLRCAFRSKTKKLWRQEKKLVMPSPKWIHLNRN